MRVLCFGRFFDEIPGGMQKHVDQLFISLHSQVKYTHLVPSRDSSSASFYYRNVLVIRTPSFNIDGSLAVSPSLIYTAIQSNKTTPFDLIHLHFPDPMSHIASLFLPSQIPRIITWHCDIIRQKILIKPYSPLIKKTLKDSSAIIIPTPTHSKSPLLLNHLEKSHLIPFGFDLSLFAIPHPEHKTIKEKYPGQLIFALGRHVYYKGFDILIETLRYLPTSTRVIIGGIGPLTENWKNLAHSQGVSDRVHFVGLISDNQLPAYYQACDIFCLPATSPAEAFGIVQVEAMAAGKPVVSTRLNNGVDFVNQHGITGLTVEPNDVNDLANALNKLLADPLLRQQLGENARFRAFNDFSLEVMGKKTLELYQQVIAENKKQ